MTYPSYGGRLLSPADLERLERYRQLIATSALRQLPVPHLSPLSGDAAASPWVTADSHGSILDSLSAGSEGDSALGPQTHLLTASFRSPGSLPARERSVATPVSLPLFWTKEQQSALSELWKRLNDALRPYADIKPGFVPVPLPGVPGLAPVPGGPAAFPPIFIPGGVGGAPDWPGKEVAPPILPGREPRPPMPPDSSSPGKPPVPANVPPKDFDPAAEPVGPTILTGPDLFAQDFVDFIYQRNGGRLGKTLTRRANDIIVQECLKVAQERYPQFEHIGGATEGGGGDNEKRVNEYYIPNEEGGRLGSSFTDTGFGLDGFDGRTAHIQSVSRRVDGTLTLNEARRDANLFQNLERTEADHIARNFAIRKMEPNEDEYTYRQEARRVCNEALDSLLDAYNKAERTK